MISLSLEGVLSASFRLRGSKGHTVARAQQSLQPGGELALSTYGSVRCGDDGQPSRILIAITTY